MFSATSCAITIKKQKIKIYLATTSAFDNKNIGFNTNLTVPKQYHKFLPLYTKTNTDKHLLH
jgi:rRNA pseudouridine-1189 N-methylase Emg1 (Nep1/Mra1 family)